jgi:hypothetical protein
MATFKFSQLPVRKEVLDFLVAAEKLLSPVLRDKELTPEECHLISEYLTTSCRDNPSLEQSLRVHCVRPGIVNGSEPSDSPRESLKASLMGGSLYGHGEVPASTVLLPSQR